jgi:hypothetical protein
MAGAEVDDEIIASDSSMGPVGSGSPVVENTGSTSQAVNSVASDSSMGPANVVSTASFLNDVMINDTRAWIYGYSDDDFALPIMSLANS